jgi:hypothetical protein
MRIRRWWTPALVCALSVVALAAAGCSGGGGSSSSSSQSAAATPAARQQGALEAARACRMWSEVMGQVVPKSPLTPAAAAPYDAKSGAIAAAANAASTADPAWNTLSIDIAGGNDFASAALPDINNRIVTDCQEVPTDVIKTVAAEPDPFTTTTTTP